MLLLLFNSTSGGGGGGHITTNVTEYPQYFDEQELHTRGSNVPLVFTYESENSITIRTSLPPVVTVYKPGGDIAADNSSAILADNADVTGYDSGVQSSAEVWWNFDMSNIDMGIYIVVCSPVYDDTKGREYRDPKSKMVVVT